MLAYYSQQLASYKATAICLKQILTQDYRDQKTTPQTTGQEVARLKKI
ncbi:hypothetical protein DSUL_150027 [Desulfovibrionales bacterium]